MKISCVIFLFAVLTINVQGQIFSGYGFKLGVGNSNQIWDDNWDINWDFESKNAFTARFFADVIDLPVINVQGEIGYSRKGFEGRTPIPVSTTENPYGEYININVKLDYITLAMLAKIKFSNGIISPYVIGGPQYNILVSKSNRTSMDQILNWTNENTFGFSIGAGLEILDVLPLNFLVEYRYEKDLQDNYDGSVIDIKNYSHSIMAGIHF